MQTKNGQSADGHLIYIYCMNDAIDGIIGRNSLSLANESFFPFNPMIVYHNVPSATSAAASSPRSSDASEGPEHFWHR